jgi:hypothetical protein
MAETAARPDLTSMPVGPPPTTTLSHQELLVGFGDSTYHVEQTFYLLLPLTGEASRFDA